MGGSGSQLRAEAAAGSIVTVSAQPGAAAAPPTGDPILARLRSLRSESPLLSADNATFAEQLDAELDSYHAPAAGDMQE